MKNWKIKRNWKLRNWKMKNLKTEKQKRRDEVQPISFGRRKSITRRTKEKLTSPRRRRRRKIKVGRNLICWSKLPKLLHSPATAPKTWRTKFLVKNLIGSNFNPQQVHWSIVATISSPWGRSLKEWLWNPEILNTETNKSQQENKNKNKLKLRK